METTKQISEEDKARIEKAAQQYENDYPVGMFLKTRKNNFQSGAEYERLLANQQLEKKNREILECDEQIQLLMDLVKEKDIIIAEKDKEIESFFNSLKFCQAANRRRDEQISTLQEALRDMKEEIDLMESGDSEQVSNVKKYLLEEIEQLLR